MEGGHNPSDGLAERVFKSVSLPGTVMVLTLGASERALEKAITQAARAGAR